MFQLLDIPEQLKSFREEIEGLFTTIEPYLSVFRIYDKMDHFSDIEPELKQAIHNVMISFVDICSLSINLRDSGKWQKLKFKTKYVILQDDSGIKGEIEKFERLTKAHNSIQSTQTLKVLLDSRSDFTVSLEKLAERTLQIATDIGSLKASDDNRKSEAGKQKHMDNIKKKLEIKDSVYNSFKEACDKPRKDCIPNTAGWFTDIPQFKNWAERENRESEMLLIVTGDSNTGKTVTLSNIVQHLRSIYESPTHSSPRTLIAAYFWPNVTIKDDRDKRPISTALKCIAVQLADLDMAYAKSLSQSCDRKSETNPNFFRDADCQELWNFLRIGSPTGNIRHYLIFDGLSWLPDDSEDIREQKEQLFQILHNSVQPSVRVLLSVRRGTFRVENLPSHSKIEMEQNNQLDIQKCINQFLKENDVFLAEEVKTKVSDSLTKNVRGNYNKLQAALKNIEAVVSSNGLVTEIYKALDESSMSEKQITQATIVQLEKKLTGEQVDELNELLIWVIYGKEYFTIDKLDAALILRSQRKGTLPLRKKIEKMYSGILTIGTDGNVDVQENISDLLTKEKTKPVAADDAPKFTAEISITKGDLRSVQTFLWSLSQKIDSLAHDRLGFEQIPEQQRVEKNIQVNEVDGHFTIIRRTFHLLAGEPNEESKALGGYLLNYLPDHLNEITKKASGYEKLTQPQKQEIGQGLFTLFVSGEVIERHWDICQELHWYSNPSEVSIFRNWLDDASAISQLGRLDRDRLKEVKASPNPNQALLTKIMETVARHWLCERKWEATRAFKWLKGFRQMGPQSEAETTGASQKAEEDASPTDPGLIPQDTEVVTNVLEWCKSVLSITTDKDKALMNERLGEAYFGEDQFSKAIESYNDAINLASPGWESLEGLAKALAGDKQYENACQTMGKALDILSKEESPDKNGLISANYIRLAEWRLELEQSSSAIENMKQAIDVTPEEHDVYFGLLKIYLLNDMFDDALGFLSSLVKLGNLKNGTSLFGRVIDATLDDSERITLFGSLFGALAEHPETFTIALGEIDYAIQRAQKISRMDNMAYLLFFKGVAVYHYGLDESTRVAQAISCWKQSLDVDLPSSDVCDEPHILSSTWLCEYYFSKARKLKEPDPNVLDACLQKMKLTIQKEASSDITGSKTYLASLYLRVAKDAQSTRKMLQRHIEAAFDMLSDEIDENDWEGYYQLGDVLMFCGDDANGLSSYLVPLPELAEGTMASWVLEFETEEEQKLSDELVTAMEMYSTERSAADQIKFILEHVEHALSEIGGLESGVSLNTTGQEDRTTNHETPITPSDSTNTTHNEQTAVTSSFIPKNPDSTVDKPTGSKVDRGSEKIGMKATYKTIRHRVQEWSGVLNSTAAYFRCRSCNKVWDFKNAISICKHCFNMVFCDECLAKLKAGKLKKTSIDIPCKMDHDWLCLPRWDKEMYMRSLNKNVWVGGQIENEGRLVGGTTMPVAEWLAGLKKQWGITEKQNPEHLSAEE